MILLLLLLLLYSAKPAILLEQKLLSGFYRVKKNVARPAIFRLRVRPDGLGPMAIKSPLKKIK